MQDAMDFPVYTRQSSIANGKTNDLTDDFMFGFDVDDEDDRQYLADVAMHNIGQDEDIRGFICLALHRGVEEWEQAICRASTMRERASESDKPDVLDFLSVIYGVDGLSGSGDALSRPASFCAQKGGKETGGPHRADVSLGVPARKKRKSVREGRDSPYWADASFQESAQIQEEAGAKRTREKRRSLEVLSLQKLAVRKKGLEDNAVHHACQGSRLSTVSSDDGNEPLGRAPFLGIQSNQLRDCNTRGIPEDSRKVQREFSVDTQDTDTPGQSLEDKDVTDEANNSKTNTTLNDSEQLSPTPTTTTTKRKAISPYFKTSSSLNPPKQNPPTRPPRNTISALPFPRLDAPRFGLIQEELATDPFRLLIAVTFLIRTPGKVAIPVFRALMREYPTPSALANASPADIEAKIKHLGLGAVRAATIQRYARLWLAEPPRAGVCYAVRNYGAAWEIGHMTQGAYALDSWRIFCRDVLRGVASDWKGGGRGGEFQPEWMRVLPGDKELRACLRWMWMREGWRWDPETGEKVVLEDRLGRAVQEGRVGYDEKGDLKILEEPSLGSAMES
ncbi:DNA glycosylase [Xylaria nigripes]|nr:DNA glycosylase [Xylaria nigripes]